MPAWVKDHSKWQKAKEAILKEHKENDEGFWAMVASVYKKFGGKVDSTEVAGAHMLGDEVIRASLSEEVVQAAGTSEGAKKGWEHRGRWEASHHWDATVAHHEAAEQEDVREKALAHKLSQSAHAASYLAKVRGGPGPHQLMAAQAHEQAAQAHRSLGNKTLAGQHDSMAAEHARENYVHGSDPKSPMTPDTIHCRDYAGTRITAATPWAVDNEVKLMHMPSGVHTITAGFRDRAVRLTVEVDPESTANTLQASFNRLQSSAPKQKPFGCIEHDERDASIWPNRFEAGPDGVYLAGEPSALGAEHVNGKIHRSWSPSFTTDADYAKAVCSECRAEGGDCACKGSVLEFPDGVRGSVSNPARVTGTAFVVGTLTNKPAFRAISPVKAKETDAAVRASGTSEGAEKGWEHRHIGYMAGLYAEHGEGAHTETIEGHHLQSSVDSRGGQFHHFTEHGIEVRSKKHFGVQHHEVTVNWPGHGSKSVGHSEHFHKALGHAVTLAKALEEHHGKGPQTKATDHSPAKSPTDILRAKPAPDRRPQSILARLKAAGQPAA